MGVLGGSLLESSFISCITGFLLFQLPDSFAFFSGGSFCTDYHFSSFRVCWFDRPLIWPLFAMVIMAIGQLIQRSGIFGPFLFGSGERLLLPFGLHHILVSMIRFTEAGGSAMH